MGLPRGRSVSFSLPMLLALLIITYHAMAAGALTITPVADSSIIHGRDSRGNVLDGRNYGSDTTLFLGKVWQMSLGSSSSISLLYVGRVVLNFPLTSVSCPVGKAELVLRAKEGRNIMVRVYSLKKGFVEGEVTWERAKKGDPWSGGEYDSSAQLDHKYYSELRDGDEVRLDITEWVRSNRMGMPDGLVLDSGGSSGYARFYSKESTYPPKIEVMCTSLPGPRTSLPLPTSSTTGSTTTVTSSSITAATSSTPPPATSTPTTSGSPTAPTGFHLRIRPTYLQLVRRSEGRVLIDVVSTSPTRVNLREVCPSAIRCSLSTTSGTAPFSSNLTIVSGGAGEGSYEIRIIGESSTERRERIVRVRLVSAASPYFTLEVSPPLVEVEPGGDVSLKVRVTGLGEFRDTVRLEVRPKVASIDPPEGIPPFESIVRLKVPEDARPGLLVVRVVGRCGKIVVRDEASVMIKGGEGGQSRTSVRSTTWESIRGGETSNTTASRTRWGGIGPTVSPKVTTGGTTGKVEAEGRTYLWGLALIGVLILLLGVLLLVRYRRSGTDRHESR